MSGEAGVLLIYNDASNRGTKYASVPFNRRVQGSALFKAKIGPVAMQGEINYSFGERELGDRFPVDDQTSDSLTAFLDADANFGIV